MKSEKKTEKTLRDEIQTFCPQRSIIKTVHGEEVSIPIPVWAIEEQITILIIDLLEKMTLEGKTISVSSLISALKTSSQVITHIVSLLLSKIHSDGSIEKKSEDWIKLNLDMITILNLITPFLQTRWDAISKMILQTQKNMNQ